MRKTEDTVSMPKLRIACVALLSWLFPIQADAMTTTDVRHVTISVQHVEIHSSKPFAEVAKALEATVPRLDPNMLVVMANGDLEGANKIAGGAPLFIFLKRDHGAILRTVGLHRNAIQYEIGNAMTATEMTRHKIEASLYAPLRVTLYETADGGCTFAYDQPSSLFGQFGDANVLAVGQRLDVELKTALLRAAE
jgi:hypothetical protein